MNLADLLVNEEITDEDISEIKDLNKDLKLDPDRQKFLRILDNCDVQACPGAGKTTLVGAKLAILSKKWKSNKQGICILSHTNVAKDEIIKRLEKTASGSRLLSAPHFIGTIQTFVNQFLAIPYMRDVLGWKYQNIDDDIAFKKIQYTQLHYSLKNSRTHYEVKELMKQEICRVLEVSNREKTIKDENGKIYTQVKEAKSILMNQGIHFYNDMFWIARKYLEDFPQIAEIIPQRFSLVFIDEMQDTSKLQSSVLEQIFKGSIVQRVGDLDQTLNDDCGWEIKEQNKITINGSFRFHQTIADCARTFSGSDLKSKLQGNRLVEQTEEVQKPIIILFDFKDKEKVLESFAKLLFEKFGDSLWDENGKQKIIKAVCPQHGKTIEDKVKSLKCYHSEYSKLEGELKKKEKHYFDTFFDYCILAKKLQFQVEDQKHIIQKFQDGLVQALYKASSQQSFEFRKVNNEMNNFFKKSENNDLRKVLLSILQEDNLPSENTWNSKVKQIQERLNNDFSSYIVQPKLLPDFFKYKSDLDLSIIEAGQNSSQKQAGNIAKREVSDSRELEIELSTIHSAKGQTHFATLVLYGIGGKQGNSNLVKIEKNTFSSSIPTNAYVALTRPSHFLCLALPVEEFKKDKLESFTSWEIRELTEILT